LHEKAQTSEEFEHVEKEYLSIICSCIDMYAETADVQSIERAKTILLLVDEIEAWRAEHSYKTDEHSTIYFRCRLALACIDNKNVYNLYHSNSSSNSSGSDSDDLIEIITAPNIAMDDELIDLFKKAKKAHTEGKAAWKQACGTNSIFPRKKRLKEKKYEEAEQKGLLAARCFMNMYNKGKIPATADWCIASWKLASRAGRRRHKVKKYMPLQGNADLQVFVREYRKKDKNIRNTK
jgi:hypothetical protein